VLPSPWLQPYATFIAAASAEGADATLHSVEALDDVLRHAQVSEFDLLFDDRVYLNTSQI
jgi:hypothetical protein